MRSARIVAIGAAIMLILLGFGGCRYLWGMGEAAARGKTQVEVNVPGLMRK